MSEFLEIPDPRFADFYRKQRIATEVGQVALLDVDVTTGEVTLPENEVVYG